MVCLITLAAGLATLLVRSGLRLAARGRRRKGHAGGWQQGLRQPLALFAAAGAVALFAFGLPFRMLEDGARYLWPLGPAGQFRAPGRFIWPLFYAGNVVAVAVLWRVWSASRRSRGVRFAVHATPS